MDHEKSSGETDIDLFGNPLDPIRDRRGRPSFAKNKQNQEFVMVRAAAGWSHNRISEALGCDDDTLRKHFSGELQNGRTYVEGVMLDVLMRKVREGHTPSIRQLQERLDQSVPVPAKPKAVDKNQADEPKGKKELRDESAQDVPEEYGEIYAMRRPN